MMTKEEYLAAADGLIYLAGCAVKGQTPDRSRIDKLNLEHVCEAGHKHKLAAAAGMALEKAGIRDEHFVQAVARAQRKAALLDADKSLILAKMEEAGIWYMPLKGAVLKDLYPRYGMREMSDIDILFDEKRSADLRQIMVDLGFTVKGYGKKNHDVYQKKPVSNFEMHRTLFYEATTGSLYTYYISVKDRLIPDEGKKYGCHFSDEDFYLYIIAHEYKHYWGGGTGIRSLLDTYVYLKKKTLDMDYVSREAEKIGIADFEQKNRDFALRLFDGETLTAEEEKMLNYVVFSGVYGSYETNAVNVMRKMGRRKYFLSRLTVPRKVMEDDFPILKKAPFLYPVIWVVRLLRGVFLRNEKFRAQLKASLGLGRRADE